MRGSRILLCEDDRETRWALATVLRQEGVKIHEAQNGEEGLGFLRRGEYDLVISDVSMPGLGGFGLFAALRFGEGEQLTTNRETPIMLVSGRASRGELARALDAGVDEFMAKPVDPHEFKARVRNLLRKNRSTTAARTSGDLQDFGMRSLGQALHTAGRNARVSVTSGEMSAVLDFVNGKVVNAIFEGGGTTLTGEKAAVEALALEKGAFEIGALPGSFPRNVFDETEPLLLRACARADETASSTTSDIGSREIANVFREASMTPTSRPRSFQPDNEPATEPVTLPISMALGDLQAAAAAEEEAAPSTGRVYSNDGAGTEEVDIEALLGEVEEALEQGADTYDDPSASATADGDEPETPAPEEAPMPEEDQASEEIPQAEAADGPPPGDPTPGSVLETALSAGAYDLDDDDDDDAFSTDQVLGAGGVDVSGMFEDEDDGDLTMTDEHGEVAIPNSNS